MRYWQRKMVLIGAGRIGSSAVLSWWRVMWKICCCVGGCRLEFLFVGGCVWCRDGEEGMRVERFGLGDGDFFLLAFGLWGWWIWFGPTFVRGFKEFFYLWIMGRWLSLAEEYVVFLYVGSLGRAGGRGEGLPWICDF